MKRKQVMARTHKKHIRLGKKIVKELDKGTDSSLIRNVPSTKYVINVPRKASSQIDKIIKSDRSHEIYGSAAQYTHSFSSRKPNDIDIVTNNPIQMAGKIKSAISKKGFKSRIIPSKSHGAYIVQYERGNKWRDVADVHPKRGFHGKYDVYGKSIYPEKIDGFNVQPSKDQLLRKSNSILTKEGASLHRVVKDEADFITSSRLIIDTNQLRTEAHIVRGHNVKSNKSKIRNIKKLREDLEIFKKHIKTHKEYTKHKYPINKDPIPEKKEQQFLRFAKKNSSININNMFFSEGRIKVKKSKRRKSKKDIFKQIMGI